MGLRVRLPVILLLLVTFKVQDATSKIEYSSNGDIKGTASIITPFTEDGRLVTDENPDAAPLTTSNGKSNLKSDKDFADDYQHHSTKSNVKFDWVTRSRKTVKSSEMVYTDRPSLVILSSEDVTNAEEQIQPCDDNYDLGQHVETNCTINEPEKYSCMNRCGDKTSIPDPPFCSCDLFCGPNDDCCLDYNTACPDDAEITRQIQKNMTSKNIMFDCIDIKDESIGKNYRQLVTRCSNDVTCKNADVSILNLIPVADSSSDIHYINRFCALCNNVSAENIVPWPSDVECGIDEHFVQSIDDLVSYIENGVCQLNLTIQARRCFPIIEDCSEYCTNGPLKDMCSNGPRQAVNVGNIDKNFKNEFCALCNDYPRESVKCNVLYFAYLGSMSDGGLKRFSFSLLLDINPNKGTKIGFSVNGASLTYDCSQNGNCNNLCDLGYEYKNEKCVHVYSEEIVVAKFMYSIMLPYTQALTIDLDFIEKVKIEAGGPLNRGNLTHVVHYDGESLNCTITAVFTMKTPVNQTLLFLHNTSFYDVLEAFNEIDDYEFNDFNTFKLCVESYNMVTCFDVIQQVILKFPEAYIPNAFGDDSSGVEIQWSTVAPLLTDSADTMGLVTIICLSISIICMITRLVLQFFVPVFHTISGKMQFSLVLALCLASCLYLVGPMLGGIAEVCKTVGVLIHYFYLVTFAWMSIIAIDLYLTFKASLQTVHKGLKHFFVYSLMAWVLPGAVVSVSVALDHADIPYFYKPMYGNQVCLISNKYANLIFFAGPLALMIMLNIVFYTLTVCKLRQTWEQTAQAKSDHKSHLDVYVKLFIIMGFTWIVGFVAPFVGSDFVWYLFIILNASQGAFIFVASVCAKRVLRSVKCFKHVTGNSTSSSFTHTSNATQIYSNTKF